MQWGLIRRGKEKRAPPVLVCAGPPGYRDWRQCCLCWHHPHCVTTAPGNAQGCVVLSGHTWFWLGAKAGAAAPRELEFLAKDSRSVAFLKMLSILFRLPTGRGVSTGCGVHHVPSSLLSRRRAWLGSARLPGCRCPRFLITEVLEMWTKEAEAWVLPTTGPWHS